MPECDVILLRERERFPCKSGARGQGPNTMVKCELRTINESGHKLIEFLLINSQVIVTLEFHIVLAGK